MVVEGSVGVGAVESGSFSSVVGAKLRVRERGLDSILLLANPPVFPLLPSSSPLLLSYAF